MKDEQGRPACSRRRLLGAAVGLAGLSAAPAWARDSSSGARAGSPGPGPKVVVERALSFRHRHTDETLKTVYYENGRYIPSALKDVNWLLRDFRNDEIKEIDPRLLDLLYAVQLRLENGQPFEVYSGYRSPATNAQLRREGWGVARNSLHMHGMAIDIGLPGSPLARHRQLRAVLAARWRRLLWPFRTSSISTSVTFAPGAARLPPAPFSRARRSQERALRF